MGKTKVDVIQAATLPMELDGESLLVSSFFYICAVS